MCSVHLGVDFPAMAADQPRDLEILALKTTGTDLKLEDDVVQEASPRLLCDVSTGRPCPIVPAYWCRRVFDMVQSLLHLGVQASVKLLGSKFVWPDLRKEVRE